MSKTSKALLTILFLIVLIMTQFLPITAEVHGDSPTAVITAASTNSITFEVKVPVDEIFVEIIQTQNEAFSNLHLPGFSKMSQAGAPQLPFLTEVLGVPFDSEISV